MLPSVLRHSPTPSLPTTPTLWSAWPGRCSSSKRSSSKRPQIQTGPPRRPNHGGLTPTWTKTQTMAPSCSRHRGLRAPVWPKRSPLLPPPTTTPPGVPRSPQPAHPGPAIRRTVAATSTPSCLATLQQQRPVPPSATTQHPVTPSCLRAAVRQLPEVQP